MRLKSVELVKLSLMETVFFIIGFIHLTVASNRDVIASHQNDSLVPFAHLHEGAHPMDNVLGYISKFVPITYLLPDNSTCRIHSIVVREEARNLNVWALKIIDATAKVPSGILNGNLNQYGDFDECITSKALYRNEEIKGKYCLPTISMRLKRADHEVKTRTIDDLIHSNRMFTNELNDAGHRIPKLETFNWGVCIPHSCTNLDLQKAVQSHLNNVMDPEEIETDVLVNENMCFEDGERQFTTINKLALLFFIFVIIWTLFATLIDVYCPQENPTKLHRYINCFSLKRNFSALFKTDVHPDDIPLLHGARFLNAIALLLSHKQMALMFNPIVNRTEMSESLGKAWSMIGRSAILYTDTFILISGLLLSYSLIKELDTKKKMNFRERFISRLFRFTPNLVALVVFCTFLMEHIGSGPQWGLVVKQYADLCKRNMWQNFLYIHNYFGFENMCLTHTHQLGIDMQLFVVSPVVVYILWKNTKKGVLLAVVLGVASTCLRYYVTVKERISTLIYFGISVDRLWKTASLSYILPTHRLTVYLVGIALGYYLRRSGRKMQLAYGFKWMGWIFAVTSGLFAMFGPYHVSSKSYVYNVNDAALYNAFSPLFWVVFLSWSVLACENGWGGWFNSFLSWKYFTVFTKISYAIYLTQFPVFFYGVGTKRSPDYYKGLHSMIDLPEFLLILLISIAMTVLFDLPFQNLRKTYLNLAKTEESDKIPPHRAMKKRRRLETHGD